MKTLSIQLALLMVLILANIGVAQNYKMPYLGSDGKLKDANNNVIATISTNGTSSDNMGMKMAHIDGEGNLVDSQSGKKLGKAEKNGNFMYYFSETKDGKNFTIGAPTSGMCEVKDEKGNVVLLVHENYKMQAACAFHCSQMKMNGKEMKMK